MNIYKLEYFQSLKSQRLNNDEISTTLIMHNTVRLKTNRWKRLRLQTGCGPPDDTTPGISWKNYENYKNFSHAISRPTAVTSIT
jgi:hypothetical protein